MRYILVLFLVCSGMLRLAAQDPASVRLKHYNLEKKLAIEGYDPVAYFKLNKAVKGKREWAISHQGVIYYFSTAENKEIFKTSPSTYEPQYGGWCAYAMGSSREKVSVDPETFKIRQGKLYLFYHSIFNNTLKSWNKDEDNLNRKADANWKNLFR